MNILVTGGRGFIGTHLCNELVAHNHKVTSLDNQTHIPAYAAKNGIYHCFLDILGEHSFQDVLNEIKPDYVVHLAAQVGRLFGEDDLVRCIRSNGTMTTLVANACGKAQIPMLYSSSSEIYGDNGEISCHEDLGPFKVPHNLYGLSKRWGEEACQLYAPEGLAIVRLSMPYGPGAPPGRGRRAMDNFLWQAHHCMPIEVHAGAERSWCWVGDTVRAIRMVIEDGHTGAYNIGRDDDPISMFALANKACAVANAPRGLIKVVKPPERQTVVKRLSTQKIRSIGWSPKVELQEGLPLVYEWVKRFDSEGKFCG